MFFPAHSIFSGRALVNLFHVFFMLCCMIFFSAPGFAAPCAAPDNLTRVTGADECLIIKTYISKEASSQRRLVVLLHGNHSSGSPAISLYKVAEDLVLVAPAGTVAVAMIRPGYNNADGEMSSGDAAGRADNFTAQNIDIVADAIARLKHFYKAGRVVLVGHSGGAAMAGVMLGRHPDLADAAVIVSCPCNVPSWRAMRGRAGSAWSSESAVNYVDRIRPAVAVSVIVGKQDDVTPPALSSEYVETLRRQRLVATLTLLDDVDHVNVIASETVIQEALRLLLR
jgi:pimeloyl-ACP methyl ester carboxylesterase